MNQRDARTTRTAVILALLLAGSPVFSAGQQPGGGGEANPRLMSNRESLEAWQAMRFGMFVHWGPVTLRGTEIGWSRGTQVPIEDYDSLYKEFNPVLFNAKEWIGAAKAAGMKYFVITTKHHDGFCLWDSRQTEYDIMATPLRRDVLKELAAECRRQGIVFGTYYSILDWHHPHYTTRYGGDRRPVESSNMDIYRQYLKAQIAELVADYGTNILWFDGEWEESWTHADGMGLYAYGRSLNDRLLINNRVDKGRAGMQGMTTSGRFAGDFGTPEQEIGAFDNQNPWESNITIATQWAWKPNDRVKSAKECIQMLAKTAGRGGNLLLNISPMPDGRFEQRQMERLQAIGRWMDRHGESIYGTRGGPLKPTPWMASTSKGNSIFVHLLRVPKEELLLPVIPGRKIKGVRVLGGASLQSRAEKGQVAITLPRTPLDESVAVLALDLDGPVEGIAPLDAPENVFAGADSRVTLKGSPGFPAQGPVSLADKVRGTEMFRDGNWVGFEGEDLEAVIDLGAPKAVTAVTVGCLEDQANWVFFPAAVEVAVSDDGAKYAPAGKLDVAKATSEERVSTKDLRVPCGDARGRFVKVRVMNIGRCPPWHKGAGGSAWVFVDEITIN